MIGFIHTGVIACPRYATDGAVLDLSFFFFNDTATTEFYTLSLHDALPIYSDQFFPLAAVRATRDALNARGFSTELIELPGHDHWYYDLASKINRTAWDFLKTRSLEKEQIGRAHV